MSVYPRRSPGWVGGPTGRSRTDHGTLGEFRDACMVSRGGPGRVRGPSGLSEMGRRPLERFGTDRGTIPEGWDGSGDPRVGPGHVGAHSGSCGKLGNPLGGLGWVVKP